MDERNQAGPEDAVPESALQPEPPAGPEPVAPPPASAAAAVGAPPPAAGAPEDTPHPAFDYLPREGPEPDHPEGPPAALPLHPPGMLVWAFGLAGLAAAMLALGQIEAAFLLAIAGLCISAQGADLDPRWALVHGAVAWMVPVGGATVTVMSCWTLSHDLPLVPDFLLFSLLGAATASVCLTSLGRPVADAFARALFRGTEPGHMLRLAARSVVALVALAIPLWLLSQKLMPELLEQPARLVGSDSLGGSLLGYVVLAFAAVGLFVRRGWRASFERLGLGIPRPADLLVIALGLAALWAFNAGSEAVEKRFLPTLYDGDRRFTEALASAMTPARMLLLGLSAGIGEEITLRGALQPKLGLLTTALVFAVLHVQYSWFGMLSIVAFGLILGLVRRRSGTTSAIVVHGLYDILALVLSGT